MKKIYFACTIILLLGTASLTRGQSFRRIPMGIEDLYAAKQEHTSTNFSVVKQALSHQNVLRIHIDSSSRPQSEYVYKDITMGKHGSQEVEFYLKIVSPRGVVRVEASQLDPNSGNYKVVASKDISNKDRYIPYNWTRYQLSIPIPVNPDNNTYRLTFYFNKDIHGSHAPVSLLNGESVYFLADVQQAGLHIWKGRMDEWDIENWPAKPKGWHIQNGEGYLERSRGYLLDDESMVIINKTDGVLQLAPTESISTSKKKQFVFYGRADEDGKKVEITFKQSKKARRVTLHKKWTKYAFTIGPLTQDKPIFTIKGEGRIYIDELMVL